MSAKYDAYLQEHIANVGVAFDWIKEHIPELTKNVSEHGPHFAHDNSKYTAKEYEAYDAYFYGGRRNNKVEEDFKFAWLHHIHNNPHHWQHWVLINDEPEEGTIESKVSNNVEHKSNVIDPKIVREKLAQKEKKNIGFDYIAAGAAACVLGFAMMLGLGFKRA